MLRLARAGDLSRRGGAVRPTRSSITWRSRSERFPRSCSARSASASRRTTSARCRATSSARARCRRTRPRRYFQSWEHGFTPIHVQFAQHDQPADVDGLLRAAGDDPERIGYRPAAWIKKVTHKRLTVFADDVKRSTSADPRAGSAAPGDQSGEERGGVMAAPAAHSTKAHAPTNVFTRHDLHGDTVLDCDVVIVGSGAGGSPVAAELAEAGFDVVVLEEGSYYQTRDFTANTSQMVRQLYRDGGATMAIGNPPVMFQEGRTVGGSTVINGGMSWRTPEDILARWRDEAGIDSLDDARRSSRTSSASRSGSTSRRWTTTRSATTTGCSRRAPTRRAGRPSATCATKRTASARIAARSAARPARSKARSSATSRARCTSARGSTPMFASSGSRCTASARPA